jgi:type II secretory pathway component PulF
VSQVEEMREAIVSAFMSVWLPVAMLIGLFAGVDAYFFPTIEDSMPRKDWPFITKMVASIAHNISSVVGVGTIVLAVLVALWLYSLPRWHGTGRQLAEKTLFYSKYRDYQCALFLVNLAFLMEANFAIRESLEKISMHVNGYMKSHVDGILAKLNKDATNSGEALVSTGLFSEELADLMTNYTRWHDWHTQIRGISDAALTIVTRDVKKLGPSIQSGLQLVLGVCVMVVFASGAMASVKILTDMTH